MLYKQLKNIYQANLMIIISAKGEVMCAKKLSKPKIEDKKWSTRRSTSQTWWAAHAYMPPDQWAGWRNRRGWGGEQLVISFYFSTHYSLLYSVPRQHTQRKQTKALHAGGLSKAQVITLCQPPACVVSKPPAHQPNHPCTALDCFQLVHQFLQNSKRSTFHFSWGAGQLYA